MTTRLLTLAVLTSATLSVANPTTAETRELTGFTGVTAEGGVRVVLSEGAMKVVVRGPAKAVAKTKTVVRGTALVISHEGSWLDFSNERATVEVTMPSLERLDLSGGVSLNGVMPAHERLVVSTSGGTTLRLAGLRAESLILDSSGGATVALVGKAAVMTASISGGVSLDASNLVAERVTFDASGGSSATVHARQEVNGDASGASRVTVQGTPPVRHLSATGAASVK